MFKYQHQPFDNVCGQTVVAMVAGVDVAEVIAELGKRKTWARDLIAALASRGWTMKLSPFVLPLIPKWPAVLNVETVLEYRRVRHWVLWDGRKYLDPAAGQMSREIFDNRCCGRWYSLQRKTK